MLKLKNILILATAIIVLVSCQKQTPPPAQADNQTAVAGMISGKVEETMNAGGYTYILVKSGKEEIWVAAPQTELTVGEDVSFASEMEMKNFKSESLNRTFDSIHFVGSVKKGSGGMHGQMKNPHGMAGTAKQGSSSVAYAEVSGIEKLAGGVTIEELYTSRNKYADKEVSLRGQVVKFTPEIMNKNWLHLQDGSGDGKSYDITVTSKNSVNVGDVVTVKGTLVLDKDFGFGYKYDLMIENAKVAVE